MFAQGKSMDPETQYFSLPDDSEGAQPSALQAILSQLLPGQLGSAAGPSIPSPYAPGAAAPPQASALGPQAQPMVPQAPIAAAPAPQAQSIPMAQALNQYLLPGQMGAAPQAAPQSVPAAAPPAPQMPTPPKGRSVPTWLKALGAISALTGGPGAAMVDSYQQAGDQKDQQSYQNQLQQFQMKQAQADRAQQLQTAQSAQLAKNNQATQAAYGSLIKTLQGMDDPSQAAFVKQLAGNPGLSAAYGLTPQAIQQQFYDAKGNFQPVGAADTSKDDIALMKAQTQARTGFDKLSFAGQQARHDSMDPDDWQQTYGIPWNNWQPGQNQIDVTRTASQISRGNLQAAQANLTKVEAQGDPQKIKIAQGRLAEAVRQDNLVNGAKTAERAVQTRGQDLTHQDRQSALSEKKAEYRSLSQYRMNKMSGNPDSLSGLKTQQIISDRSKARTELMNLRNQGQALAVNFKMDPAVKQSQMNDIAAQTRQAQQDYNALDQLFQQKMALTPKQVNTPSALAPMPVGAVTNGLGQPVSNVQIPRGLGPLPGFPAARATPAPRQGGTIINGTFGGKQVEFHAPTSSTEFQTLTPAKRQAYMAWLQQEKGRRHR
jgi:hypothetical protein